MSGDSASTGASALDSGVSSSTSSVIWVVIVIILLICAVLLIVFIRHRNRQKKKVHPEEKKSNKETETRTKRAEITSATEGAVAISVSPVMVSSGASTEEPQPSKVAHLRNVAQGVTEMEIASKCQVSGSISPIFCEQKMAFFKVILNICSFFQFVSLCLCAF
jgi:cytoskeletal protein RodZ